MRGRAKYGAAAGLLARSAMAFAAMCAVSSSTDGLRDRCQQAMASGASAAASAPMEVNTVTNPVFHIVEEPGSIRYMADCEIPTQACYDALAVAVKRRHPKTSVGLLEHLETWSLSWIRLLLPALAMASRRLSW